jgi:hypothetical protein
VCIRGWPWQNHVGSGASERTDRTSMAAPRLQVSFNSPHMWYSPFTFNSCPVM